MIIGTLPKQVEYALMALAEMHQSNPGKLFSVRELSEGHHIPFDVMSKTMQRLSKSGILRSVKGIHGGYQIVRDLGQVSLFDLMQSVLGEVATVTCLKKGGVCQRAKTCNVAGPMKVLDARLRDLYSTIILMSLIGGKSDESIK